MRGEVTFTYKHTPLHVILCTQKMTTSTHFLYKPTSVLPYTWQYSLCGNCCSICRTNPNISGTWYMNMCAYKSHPPFASSCLNICSLAFSFMHAYVCACTHTHIQTQMHTQSYQLSLSAGLWMDLNWRFQGSTPLGRAAVLFPSMIPPTLQALVARRIGVRLQIRRVFILMYVLGEVGGISPAFCC